MELFSLKPNKGATKKIKRVGRGIGSGHGKTSCKGHKGMKARPGHSTKVGFEGGQMPMYRRLPKRGFQSLSTVNVKAINLQQINEIYESGEIVSPETLRTKGFYPNKYNRLKILGIGEISKKLEFIAHSYSASAKEKLKDYKVEEINSGRDNK